MQSLTAFMRKSNVRLVRCDSWHENPHMTDSRNMDHWRCLLRCESRQMTVYFSKGYAHHGAPARLPEILDCLASDASTVEQAGTFEEWADSLGYDTDSRSAERTYSQVLAQSAHLRRLLGDSLFTELLYETERE